MITVAGEALIDMIVDAAGHVDPRLGGAGFNTTRAVARLGLSAAYFGRLSGDRFGQLLQDHLDRLNRIMHRADIVKTSTEDLAYLFPGQDAADAAAQLLDTGPACVVVTDGAAPVRAFAGGKEIRADVPAAPVVDTVGAGDAFGGAFLTWWIGNGLSRSDLGDPEAVRGATQAAILASVRSEEHT